jgi:thymidylate synthase (FAD)
MEINGVNMKNSVQLIGIYGSDTTHAMSAWTSTSREITEEKENRIPALLKMLADNGHETPFEKSSLHFLVTSEVASHLHAVKHRIGVSINCESARYKELKEDKYYIPEDWSQEEQKLLQQHCEQSLTRYHESLARLTPVLGRKRAKESARFYLPYATQITYDVMFNMRSFVHFQRLRNSEHAQVEIREISAEMLRLVKEKQEFQYTLTAFGL